MYGCKGQHIHYQAAYCVEGNLYAHPFFYNARIRRRQCKFVGSNPLGSISCMLTDHAYMEHLGKQGHTGRAS